MARPTGPNPVCATTAPVPGSRFTLHTQGSLTGRAGELLDSLFVGDRGVSPMLATMAGSPATLAGYPGEVPLFCHNEQCLHRVLRSDLEGDPATQTCPRCGGSLFPASLGETSKLPGDTQIAKRVYIGGDGLEAEASLVVSGMSRMSIHRPELCLPAQGFRMSRMRKQAVQLPGRGPLEVRVVEVEKGDSRLLLVYWFVSRGHETASHTVRILRDAWARSVHNRINRWAMVAVTINRSADAAGTAVTVRQIVADLYKGLHREGVGGNGHL